MDNLDLDLPVASTSYVLPPLSVTPTEDSPPHRHSSEAPSESALSTSATAVGVGAGGGTSKPAKRTRTRTGCIGCRSRRIKCGEEKPYCAHCRRIGLECVWTKEDHQVPSGKQERTRSLTACDACRKARARCSHERPLCARCSAKNIPCVFPPPKKIVFPASRSIDIKVENNGTSISPTHAVSLSPGIPSPIEDILANDVFILQHVEVYFECVHPVSWHSFLHRGTIMEQVSQEAVPRGLMLAICATASNFLSTSDVAQDASEQWAREAKHLIMDNLDTPSLSNLATMLLVILSDENRRRRASFWTLLGAAVRLAYALQLNTESPDPSLTWADRESRRRLMWACYTLDKFLGGGVVDVMHVPDSSIKIQLPCSDRNFTLQIPVQTPSLNDSTELYFIGKAPESDTMGLSAHYMIIIYMRSRVLKYRRNLELYHRAPWESLSEFEMCMSALDTWTSTLPTELIFNSANIRERHSYSPSQLSGFLSLHTWALQCACDMVHIAMPGYAELPSPSALKGAPPGWITSTRETCHTKATQIGDLFVAILNEVPDFVCYDAGISICAFQSVRIQIEWVLLAKEQNRDRLRAEAVARFYATLRILKPMEGLFESNDSMYMSICEMLWKHGFARDLDFGPRADAALALLPGPVPDASYANILPLPPAHWMKAEPWHPPTQRPPPKPEWYPAGAVRQPESNVRDAVSTPWEAPPNDTEEQQLQWPEDLPGAADWNALSYKIQEDQVDSFLSMYTFTTF
ncbi:hypothetical protein T439DRAFT_321031 [Meredithblackwellia eburnea MCA 4105]